MVEPILSGDVEESPEARNTREVLALRLSEAERGQVAKAAELSGMPLSSWVRSAALQASAIATGRATVAPPRAPDRRVLVMLDLGPESAREHYVDGELVRR
jgi:uncharacterized protein (DUF1778 family)